MTTTQNSPLYPCALLLLLIAIGCGAPAPVIEPVTHSILNPGVQPLAEPAAIERVEPEALPVEAIAVEVIEEEIPEEEIPQEVVLEEEVPLPVETVARKAEKETIVRETLATDGIHKVTILGGDGALSVVVDESIDEFIFLVDVSAHSTSVERVRELSDMVRIDFRTPDPGSPRVMVVEPTLRAGEILTADLEVRVPPSADGQVFEMTIQDGGGNISIGSFVGKMKIVSLEGEVTIEDVVGNLTVASGSGPCTITRTIGKVVVRDGSGGLTISEVTGAVEIRDNGGPLVVRNISGDVTASNNPDGIEALNVVGDLTLFGIGHTNSKIDGVEGRITYRTGSQ